MVLTEKLMDRKICPFLAFKKTTTLDLICGKAFKSRRLTFLMMTVLDVTNQQSSKGIKAIPLVVFQLQQTYLSLQSFSVPLVLSLKLKEASFLGRRFLFATVVHPLPSTLINAESRGK